MTPEKYNDDFFKIHSKISIESADVIIPIIMECYKPNSVIDIGCGIGSWLSVWEKNGITDIIGIDGEYVNKEKLLIDKEKFCTANLEKGINISRKFDIATCLEVAEHLNETISEEFIFSLCSLSDIVIFSAAIPGQEGTKHKNEQYPTYWINIFKKNNFVPIDCIRRKIWTNKKVAWWYRQNIIVYVKKSKLVELNNLRIEADFTDENFIDIVHPAYFNYKSKKVVFYEGLLKNYLKLLKYLVKGGFATLKSKLKGKIYKITI